MRTVVLTALTLIAALTASPCSAEAFSGWHDLFRYGCFERNRADVWEALCEEVYEEGELDDLWEDRHNLFQLGSGPGSVSCS